MFLGHFTQRMRCCATVIFRKRNIRILPFGNKREATLRVLVSIRASLGFNLARIHSRIRT